MLGLEAAELVLLLEVLFVIVPVDAMLATAEAVAEGERTLAGIEAPSLASEEMTDDAVIGTIVMDVATEVTRVVDTAPCGWWSGMLVTATAETIVDFTVTVMYGACIWPSWIWVMGCIVMTETAEVGACI